MERNSEILKYLNLARENPLHYAALIECQIKSFINESQFPLTEEIIYETNEGKSAWVQAHQFLKQQTPLSPFKTHSGLERAAMDHSKDLSQNGILGHKGSDGSTFGQRILRYCKKGPGAMAEIIGADFNITGRNVPEMTILGLIIDDGVNDRGHRKTIFNPEYRYVGFSSVNQGQKIITVFNITENWLENSMKANNLEDMGTVKPKTYDNWNNNSVLHDTTNNQPTATSMFYKTRSSENSGIRKKKIIEKRENSKIYYEENSKIIETTIKLIYSDGTTEENIDKRTIYLDE